MRMNAFFSILGVLGRAAELPSVGLARSGPFRPMSMPVPMPVPVPVPMPVPVPLPGQTLSSRPPQPGWDPHLLVQNLFGKVSS